MEKRKSFIFSVFFLARTRRKDTLKEFETAIKTAPELNSNQTFPIILLNFTHQNKGKNF